MQLKSSILGSVFAGAASAIVIAAVAPAYAQQQSQQIIIEAQPLGGAINALARQTGAIIIAPSELVQAKTSRALSGSYTAQAALARLLAGSGLEANLSENGTLVVTRVAAPPAPETRADDVTDHSVETTLESIVVTGQARLNRSPARARQQNFGVSDSIGTLEIERLGDTNLAQALTRVPGVSAVRGFQTSQERTVAIRGVDSRYNSLSLDGGMLWNSTRNQRSIHVDVLPASIINEITVHKTVTPDLDPNSIGGHVALRTLRSFDYGGRPFGQIEGAVGLYDQDSATGDADASYNLDGVYKATFGPSGNFGFVVGGAVHRDEFFDRLNAVQGYLQTGPVDVPSGFLQRGNFNRISDGQSALFKLEARNPGRAYAFAVASYFAERSDENWNRGLITTAPVNITSPTIDSGQFVNGSAETFLGTYLLEKKTYTVTTGAELQVGDLGKVSGLLSYLHYDHDELFSQGARFSFGGLAGSYNIGNTTPSVSLLNPPAGLSDPALWRHANGVNSSETSFPMSDDVWTGRLDYDFNTQEGASGLGFKTGVYFRTLQREFDQTTVDQLLPAGVNFFLSSVVEPQGVVLSPQSINPISINRDTYWAFLRANGTRTVNPALTSDYRLDENVVAAHAAAYYRGTNFSLLLGGRYEKTEYESRTNRLVSGVPEPLQFGRDYAFFLPNAQFQYDLSADWRLKVAYTETIARPDFNNFAQGRSENFGRTGERITNSSNPDLRARESQNVDIALEHFGDLGYASITLFSKDIANEIFQQTVQTRDASGVVVATESFPRNVGSATLLGAEFAFGLDSLEFVSPLLTSFSLSGNLVVLEGELEARLADGTPRVLEGLVNTPEWLSNVTFAYDDGRYSGALGYTGRGTSTTGIISANPAGDGFAQDYHRLDAKFGIQVTDYLQVFLEARNLNEAWFVEDNRRGSLNISVNPGRSVFLGARFRR